MTRPITRPEFEAMFDEMLDEAINDLSKDELNRLVKYMCDRLDEVSE